MVYSMGVEVLPQWLGEVDQDEIVHILLKRDDFARPVWWSNWLSVWMLSSASS